MADLCQALDRALSKQRVRAELEKSVSSMVIPEDVLQRALAKKKEQKRRRRKKEGVTPAEAPYVSPLEGNQGKAAAMGAAGAGIAALVYALSGKRAPARRGDDWPAHQVDGRNSSDQFAAQIADENMIPERVPAAIE